MIDMTGVKRFKGKTIIVTGAGSGIGRATVVRLAGEGANIHAIDLSPEGLSETQGFLENSITTHTVSVTDETAIRTIFNRVASDDGLHGVANMAGILAATHTVDTSVDAFRGMIDTNLVGTFICCREALPHLENNSGAIVNAASTSSFFGHPYMAAYSASKGGIAAMTKAIAWEYIKRGVRVNAVAPGGIATAMTEAIQNNFPEGLDMSLYMHLSRPDFQTGSPEHVASVIAMLLSDDASFMTGEIVRIDGGVHA